MEIVVFTPSNALFSLLCLELVHKSEKKMTDNRSLRAEGMAEVTGIEQGSTTWQTPNATFKRLAESKSVGRKAMPSRSLSHLVKYSRIVPSLALCKEGKGTDFLF